MSISEILTSVGKFNSKDVSVDKVMWLKKHFPQLVSKFNYVTKSNDKARWASEDTLLVDDRIKCVVPFEKKGGNVILYKAKSFSANAKTIDKLLNK